MPLLHSSAAETYGSGAEPQACEYIFFPECRMPEAMCDRVHVFAAPDLIVIIATRSHASVGLTSIKVQPAIQVGTTESMAMVAIASER